MDGGNGDGGTLRIGGGVSCTLKLDMELERVVNVGVFKEEVANDVATALGMNPARVRVVEVHPHTDVDTSSIYVDIQLNPDIYSSEKKLVAQLVVQSQDRSSVLMCGKRTSRTISVSRTQDVGSSSYSYSPQHTDDGEVSWIVSPPNTEATVDFLKVPSPVVISRGESLDISSVDISMSESKVQGPSSAVTQYDEQKSEEERAAAEWEEKWEQESAKIDEERERSRVRMLVFESQLAQDHPRGENDDGAEMVGMVRSDTGAVGLFEENDCCLGVKNSEKWESGRRAMPTRRPSHGEIVGLQTYNFSPPKSR